MSKRPPLRTSALTSGVTRSTRSRGDVTRARIVRAARRLMVQGGPAGLTLRAVAAHAGIALSNLQFHFANQDALLRAVLDAELAHAETFVARAVAAHPQDPNGAAIDALLALQHERGAARLFFSMWAVATVSRPLRAALHRFYADWIARIADLAAPEAAARAWMFVALIEGASLFRCGITGQTSPEHDAQLRTQLLALIGRFEP